MSKYATKPVTVDAIQWWKNGDHPKDNAARMQPEIPECEGEIVRYFRHPSVPGTDVCELCSRRYSDHGWIEKLNAAVCPGTWLVTEPSGQLRLIPADQFDKIFDAIDDAVPEGPITTWNPEKITDPWVRFEFFDPVSKQRKPAICYPVYRVTLGGPQTDNNPEGKPHRDYVPNKSGHWVAA